MLKEYAIKNLNTRKIPMLKKLKYTQNNSEVAVMQNKRTWLFLILLLILFSLIVAQQQQINDLNDELNAVQQQCDTLQKQLTTEHITPPMPPQADDNAGVVVGE